jgi:hypothetical protein
VEPEVAARWGDEGPYPYIKAAFGIGTPRVLAEAGEEFDLWRTRVLKAAKARKAGSPTEDMGHLTALLEIIAEAYCRRETVRKSAGSWLGQALVEHSLRPYDGIVALARSIQQSGAVPPSAPLVVGDKLGVEVDPNWDASNAETPVRTAAAFAEALAPMLRNSREVIVWDRNFNPEKPRWQRMIRHLCAATQSTARLRSVTFELHCGVAKRNKSSDDEVSPGQFLDGPRGRSGCKGLHGEIPKDMKVSFCRWKQKPGGEWLHDRYVLTDIGGIITGSTDDSEDAISSLGPDGETAATHNVNLMTADQWRLRRRQILGPGRAFERADGPFEVTGTRALTPER